MSWWWSTYTKFKARYEQAITSAHMPAYLLRFKLTNAAKYCTGWLHSSTLPSNILSSSRQTIWCSKEIWCRTWRIGAPQKWRWYLPVFFFSHDSEFSTTGSCDLNRDLNQWLKSARFNRPTPILELTKGIKSVWIPRECCWVSAAVADTCTLSAGAPTAETSIKGIHRHQEIQTSLKEPWQ